MLAGDGAGVLKEVVAGTALATGEGEVEIPIQETSISAITRMMEHKTAFFILPP
jgi:hypothetical protein